MNQGAYIANPPRREIVHYDWGGTKDIQKVIMSVVDKDDLKEQVRQFAEQYRGSSFEQQKEGLRRLWQTCRSQIKYQEDPQGLQAVKHPARTWKERKGDCKSLTVFIYHCCRALDIPVFIRFASYDKNKQIGHVYPVAVVGGQCIPVDAVWHRFDDEKPPTYYENHLPAVFANDAEMVQAVKTSTIHSSAIGAINTSWERMKDWQKAATVFIGGWITYKLVSNA